MAEVTEATGIATFQRVDAGSQTLPLEQTETGMQTQSMPKPRRGRVNGRATQTDSDNRPSDFELPTVTKPCWTEVAVLRKDDIVKIEVPFLSHDREVVIDSAAPSWGQNIQKMMICMMGKIYGTADDILEVKTLATTPRARRCADQFSVFERPAPGHHVLGSDEQFPENLQVRQGRCHLRSLAICPRLWSFVCGFG